MTDTTDRAAPDPRKGYSAETFVKLLCAPSLMARVDGKLKAWRDDGYDAALLLEREPRPGMVTLVDPADAWWIAREALQELDDALNEVLPYGAVQVWRFECPVGPIDRSALGDISRADQRRILSQHYTKARNRALWEKTFSCTEVRSDSYELLKWYVAPSEIRPASEAPPGSETISFALIYPPIDQPDFPSAMAEMSLGDAFRRYVSDDPLVRSALHRAELEPYGYECLDALEGAFSPKSRFWPATFEPVELANLWANTRIRRKMRAAGHLGGETVPPKHPKDVTEASKFMHNRIRDFLAPLRSGSMVAKGRLDGSIARDALSPVLWSRPSTRIDFINGEVLRADDGAATPMREWTEIVLESVDAPAAPATSTIEPERTVVFIEQDQVDYEDRFPWRAAFDQLIINMLDETPRNGRHLIQMMTQSFIEIGGRRDEPPEANDFTRQPDKAPRKGDAPKSETIEGWFKNYHRALWDHVVRGGK